MSKIIVYARAVFITVLFCIIHSYREISTFARSLIYLYHVDLMAASGSGSRIILSHNRPII
jgi:hypothetical protein